MQKNLMIQDHFSWKSYVKCEKLEIIDRNT